MKKQVVKPLEQYQLEKIRRRLINEEEVYEFFIANMTSFFIEEGQVNSFLGNYCRKENFQTYHIWKAWWNASYYNLEVDLKKLQDSDLKSLIKCPEQGDHPELFKRMMAGDISLHSTVCICAAIPGLLDYWEKTCQEEFLFPQYCHFLKKYTALLKFDRKRLRKIVDTTLQS